MLVWECWLDGVAPPPTVFEPGNWVPMAPGSWDSINGEYTNCTSDLILTSLESTTNVGYMLYFTISIKVLETLPGTAKITIYDQDNSLSSIINISSYVVGTHKIVHSVHNPMLLFAGNIRIELTGIAPCTVTIKEILYSYDKQDGSTGGDPEIDHPVIVSNVDKVTNCGGFDPDYIQFCGKNNITEDYHGIWKLYYSLNGTDYTQFYESSAPELCKIVNLPISVDDIDILAKVVKAELYSGTNSYKIVEIASCQDECSPFSTDTWVGQPGTLWAYNGYLNTSGQTSIISTYTLSPQTSRSIEVTIQIEDKTDSVFSSLTWLPNSQQTYWSGSYYTTIACNPIDSNIYLISKDPLTPSDNFTFNITIERVDL